MKEKQIKNKVKYISIFITILGVIIILISTSGMIYVSIMQHKHAKYLEQIKSDYSLSNENVKQEYKNGDLIGVIKIPKINVDLPIIEGATKENLKLGACRIKDTRLFNQGGNTAIAGHRNYIYSEMFNRLDEIEINDIVIIEFENHVLYYKIYSIFIVTPDNISVLEDDEEESITLITCTPIYVASHRLTIKANRLKLFNED